MTWHSLLPLAVFFVTFLASLLSGMAGGGGGFIMTPFYILIGLTPREAVATGKFASFGLTAGAVAAFKKRMLDNRRFSIAIIIVATLVGLTASFLLRSVDNNSLQRLMGAIMLALVPFMLRKSRGFHRTEPTNWLKGLGWLALVVVLLLQGILSGGIGSLVSAIFILFFGNSALEANAMKRKASLVLNIVVVLSLLTSGLIKYLYGLSGMAGGLLGGYVGSKIAINKGNVFAQYLLIVFMVVSGVWLVISA